ncbi:MAG: hypothetical protein KKC55_17830 [Gammaproteobacteria bacterium]|uniref:Uncharacterized protein n=1 Tax=viral metagenome TaxID=1070528 RepID=A0A6M3MI64_9ZZZZ|nr:hypothetical protein [Gammaproteobacteria bacterium]
MQHTDKATAAFEAWWARQSFRELFKDVKDQMRNVWVASRRELVIQLPAQYGIGGLAGDAHDRAIAMCKDAIEQPA